MPASIHFIIGTLLISSGVASGMAVARLPMATQWLWLSAGLFFFLGLGILLNRFSVRYLFIAMPLATLLAYGLLNQIWPAGIILNGQESSAMGPAKDMLIPVDVAMTDDQFEQVNRRIMRLRAPAGTRINLFAAGLGKVRMLTMTPEGVLLASLPDRGEVVALPDANHDGVADRTLVFAGGLKSPHGLAVSGTRVWIAETSRLLVADDLDRDLVADQVSTYSTELPGSGGHWTRSLALGKDGQLFLSAGSSCNACIETDERRATIMLFSTQSNASRIFAYGLRNSVGLAIDPQTGSLWASDNGRDLLGDDLPPDEINLIRDGGDYGWPYCYGKQVPDPQLGDSQRCQTTLPSRVDLQAHSAPLGIAFGAGLNAPDVYRNMLYVAYHGSWNRTVPTGYKLVGIPFVDGEPAAEPVDLIDGWLTDGLVWGRPVGPYVGADGALYLSDDKAGVIYRIDLARAAISTGTK